MVSTVTRFFNHSFHFIHFCFSQVDTAGTLSAISNRLKAAGAANIYLCASHGLFSNDSMKLIDGGPVKKVFVTNSLPMPKLHSDKIEQISVAKLLARVILSEHFRLKYSDDEAFEMD